MGVLNFFLFVCLSLCISKIQSLILPIFRLHFQYSLGNWTVLDVSRDHFLSASSHSFLYQRFTSLPLLFLTPMLEFQAALDT